MLIEIVKGVLNPNSLDIFQLYEKVFDLVFFLIHFSITNFSLFNMCVRYHCVFSGKF